MEVAYTPIDLGQSAFEDRVPVRQRVEEALVHSVGLSRVQLASAIGANRKTVENIVSTMKGQGLVMEMPGGLLRYVSRNDA